MNGGATCLSFLFGGPVVQLNHRNNLIVHRTKDRHIEWASARVPPTPLLGGWLQLEQGQCDGDVGGRQEFPICLSRLPKVCEEQYTHGPSRSPARMW